MYLRANRLTTIRISDPIYSTNWVINIWALKCAITWTLLLTSLWNLSALTFYVQSTIRFIFQYNLNMVKSVTFPQSSSHWKDLITPSPIQDIEISGHSQVLQGHSPSQAISVLLQAALHAFSYVSPSTPHTGASSSVHSHFDGQGHSCSHSGSTLEAQF